MTANNSARADGDVRHNCWTCRRNSRSLCPEFVDAEDAVAVRQWARGDSPGTWMLRFGGGDIAMPDRDSDGCPGWEPAG